MAYNVKFLQGLSTSYSNLGSKDNNTFYYTTDTKDLYLGSTKLSNGADLDAAILRIAANEGEIVNIKKSLETLTGTNLVELQQAVEQHGTAIDLLSEGKADKAETLAGYGIKDAYTKTEVDNTVGGLQEQITANAEAIEAEALRATNAEEGLSGRIDVVSSLAESNEARLNTLEGAATLEGSIDYRVATAIAGVVADAPEDFDTLKEIAEYIASDKTGAAELSNAISKNATDIAAEVERAKAAEVALGERIDGVSELANNAKSHSEGVASNLAKEIEDRQSAVSALEGQISEVNTLAKAAATKEELSAVVSTQAGVDSAQNDRITILEGKVGSSESIAKDIQDAKDGAISAANLYTDGKVSAGVQEAKDAAATDATSKANAAEQNAKKYADDLAKNYATAAQGALAETAVQEVKTGVANGTIQVTKGTTTSEVAVQGLKSAAFVETSAFDAAGSAATAQSNAEAHSDSNLNKAKEDATTKADTALASAKEYTDNALSWGSF